VVNSGLVEEENDLIFIVRNRLYDVDVRIQKSFCTCRGKSKYYILESLE